jgi:outer membrane protein insertion porin family
MTSSEAEPGPAPAAPAASSPAPDATGSAAGAPDAVATPAAGGVPGVVDYEALYEQIKDKPCHVVQINQRKDGFNGGTFRTRASLIDRELEPIYKAQTLAEVHEEMEAAGKRLRHLGVFTGVSMLAHEEPLVRVGELLLQDEER